MEMNSKFILTGMAAAVLLTAPLGAKAADLPQPTYKAPAYVAPYFSWTGFYVGVERRLHVGQIQVERRCRRF